MVAVECTSHWWLDGAAVCGLQTVMLVEAPACRAVDTQRMWVVVVVAMGARRMCSRNKPIECAKIDG